MSPSQSRSEAAAELDNLPILFASGLAPLVKRSPVLSRTVGELASEVTATFAVQTISGAPLQEQRGTLTRDNYQQFAPAPAARERAVEDAIRLGLHVVRSGRFGITVSGPAELMGELVGGPLTLQARRRRTSTASTMDFAENFESPRAADLFLAPPMTLSVPAPFSESVDHLVFTPPPTFFAEPSATPPVPGYHAATPADLRRVLNVPDGFDGQGVTVAMVDTGFYPHPYYAANGFDYKAVVTPPSPDPDVDTYGHGTAMALNIFATAPKAKLLGFKLAGPAQDALEDAADSGADIISCSWGYDYEQVFPQLQSTLLSIIDEGKIVLFASGNGQFAWPGSEPGVLSVGGVYWNAANQLEASNYASGFASSQFPGRTVPDICGLCGQRPTAVYIMMPTQPGCSMDQERGGKPYPEGDETRPGDGWVGASGTSAATPQVAGIVALMLQKARSKGRTLSTEDVRGILTRTGVEIKSGHNAMGRPSGGQPNAATGFGLVDASAALANV
jgi:serine protease AprX